MSPRAYNLGKRKVATEETRARIIEATRRILSAPDGVSAFTVDAVAREANVARMTLYYQFGSKMGLLESLYNHLASGTLVTRLPAAMQETDARKALGMVLDAFAAFWSTDRLIIRRLRALASLDPEVDAGIRNRDEWRRGIFTNLITRLGTDLDDSVRDDLIEATLVIAGFETFDKLADALGDQEAARLTRQMVGAELAATGISFE
jgi:AcrR family transcriptional regulator